MELVTKKDLLTKLFCDTGSSTTISPHQLTSVVKHLGDGAHGKVYKIYNFLDQQYYTIKRINLVEELQEVVPTGLSEITFTLQEDDTYLNVLLREIRILAKLDHPNILRYYTSWVEFTDMHQPTLCIQTKWYPHTLADVLHDPKLHKDSVWLSILNGVQHLHSQNIVHRDLKPDNIFLNEEMSIACIGDFGLSKHLQEKGDKFMSDDGIGTELYLAPEAKKRKKPIYTFASDIYSLGIIYLQLFSGCTTTSEFIVKLTKGEITSDMICPEPSGRPTVDDLLRGTIFHPEVK